MEEELEDHGKGRSEWDEYGQFRGEFENNFHKSPFFELFTQLVCPTIYPRIVYGRKQFMNERFPPNQEDLFHALKMSSNPIFEAFSDYI